MTPNEHKKLIEDKVNYFFKTDSSVHVKYKKINSKGENQWDNGWIEEVSADFFMLRFFKIGQERRGTDKVPVFFLEVEEITKYVDGGFK